MTISELQIISEVERAAAAESLGDVFRELRTENQWSQREAAFQMETAQYKVSELERGDWDPKLSTLIRYANAYGYGVEVSLVPKESGEPDG